MGSRGHDYRDSSIRSGKSVKIRRRSVARISGPSTQQDASSDDALALQGGGARWRSWNSRELARWTFFCYSIYKSGIVSPGDPGHP